MARSIHNSTFRIYNSQRAVSVLKFQTLGKLVAAIASLCCVLHVQAQELINEDPPPTRAVERISEHAVEKLEPLSFQKFENNRGRFLYYGLVESYTPLSAPIDGADTWMHLKSLKNTLVSKNVDWAKKIGVADVKGHKLLFPCIVDDIVEVDTLRKQLFVRINTQFGALNYQTGKIVQPFIYKNLQKVQYNQNTFWVAALESNYGLLNADFKSILPHQYSQMSQVPNHPDLLKVSFGAFEGLYSLPKKTWVMPMAYQNFQFTAKFGIINSPSTNVSIIDYNTLKITKLEFDSIRGGPGPYYVATKNWQKGLMDSNFKEVLPCEHDRIEYYGGSLCMPMKHLNSAVFYKGKLLSDYIYANADLCGASGFRTHSSGGKGYMDTLGKVWLKPQYYNIDISGNYLMAKDASDKYTVKNFRNDKYADGLDFVKPRENYLIALKNERYEALDSNFVSMTRAPFFEYINLTKGMLLVKEEMGWTVFNNIEKKYPCGSYPAQYSRSEFQMRYEFSNDATLRRLYILVKDKVFSYIFVGPSEALLINESGFEKINY